MMIFSSDEKSPKTEGLTVKMVDASCENPTPGENIDETMNFKVAADKSRAAEVLATVYAALKEKGYNPINQLVGYLLSGDPTYITNYQCARTTIRQVERDEILEELVRSYLKKL